MAAMNITLTEELREFIQQRVDSGDFGTPTEYMRHLIRLDKEQEATRRLEKALLAGIESGDAVEFTGEDWLEIRKTVRERAAKAADGAKRKSKSKS